MRAASLSSREESRPPRGDLPDTPGERFDSVRTRLDLGSAGMHRLRLLEAIHLTMNGIREGLSEDILEIRRRARSVIGFICIIDDMDLLSTSGGLGSSCS